MTHLQVAAIIGGAMLTLAAVIVKIVIPVWRWCVEVGSSIKDAAALFGGRGEYVDRVTGAKHREVLPLGLALARISDEQVRQGQDLAKQGESISDLTSVLQVVADQQLTLTEHTANINDLRLSDAIQAEQIGLLKLASSERASTADAAAQAWRAVNERDTIEGEANPQ